MRRTRLAIFLAASVLALAAVGLPAVDTSEFVGAERCRQCHATAHAAWTASPHARSQQALDARQAGDPRCTQCHGEQDRRVAGVQCESCHGPGRYYAQRHVMKDPVLARIVGLRDVTAESCRACHTDTAPTVRPYDHARMWRVIEHSREPRKPAGAPAAVRP